MLKIKELSDDFLHEQFDTWSYKSPEKGVLPYAMVINYFDPFGSMEELAQKNMDMGRGFLLSESGFSINNGAGLHVGLIYINGDEPTRPEFLPPFPLDDALSGKEPPITGYYPRVVLPAEGSFKYAPMFNYDEGIFGTSFETHKIEVPDETSRRDLYVPLDVPCEETVKAAISEFCTGEAFIPQGDYTLIMEIERMPQLCIRTDGFRPFHSRIVQEGDVRHELPVASAYRSKAIIFNKYLDRPKRPDPLERFIGNEKYSERPMVIGSNYPGEWSFFETSTLEHQGQEDKANLTYVSLRRTDSVSETATNPHLGLVEIQVSRVAKVHSVNIDYNPRRIEKLRSKFEELQDSYLLLNKPSTPLGPKRVNDSGSESYSDSPESVNTGKTELRNARTGPVSPKIQTEWDQFLWTFRFCMTNELS
tara:strand:- start:5809 stop:7068 length:1260 start_codon:yes stop_codon:yes gene_type:complete